MLIFSVIFQTKNVLIKNFTFSKTFWTYKPIQTSSKYILQLMKSDKFYQYNFLPKIEGRILAFSFVYLISDQSLLNSKKNFWRAPGAVLQKRSPLSKKTCFTPPIYRLVRGLMEIIKLPR